jgi:molybdopterin-containing oxidoreductase family molybdopterin binding subunit
MLEKTREPGRPLVSRRKFIEVGTMLAAVGAASSVVGCAPAQTNQGDAPTDIDPTEYKQVVCHTNCTGKCPIKAHMRDGRVVHLEAADYPEDYAEYKRLCVRGMNHIDWLYGSNRLQYPLRRVEGTKRGDGQWEQITWDEAIDEICTKWQAYTKEFGSTSIMKTSDGGNNEPVTMGTYQRLFSLMGGVLASPATDNNNFIAMTNSLGSGPYWNGNEWADAINAKTLVFWGRDIPINANAFWEEVLTQQEKGVRIVVVDPVYSVEASKADKWIPIAPGTDNVLVHALMKYLISENLTDPEFLKAGSVAPFLVKPDGLYLRESDMGASIGEDDEDRIMVFDSVAKSISIGVETSDPDLYATISVEVKGEQIKVVTAYNLLLERLAAEDLTLEQAAEECEIPVQDIIEFARILADGPVTINCGYGIDHYYNGYYTVFGIMTLSMLTGNLGKHGAGSGDKLNSWSGLMNYAYMVPMLDETAVAVAGGVRMGLSVKTMFLKDIFDTGYFGTTPVQPKALYIHAANIYSAYAQGDYWKDIFDRFEFIVAADIFPTETTKYADIVLPVCHWFEYQDVAGFFNTIPYAEFNDKVHEPLYESKPDFRIAQLIAAGMGLGDAFAHRDESEIIAAIFDTDAARELGLTYESLKENYFVRSTPKASDGGYYVYAEGNTFVTPTGRAQFYLEDPTPELVYEGQTFDVDAVRLPYLMRPNEVGVHNPLHEKYPLTFWTENSRYRLHTMWDRCPWLREIDPEPFCKMNPKDAGERGIKDGDLVKVFNDRGFSVQKVRLSNGLRPGVVRISKGWPRESFVAGYYQNLTNIAYDPFNVNQNYHDCVAQVEKYEEA